MCKCSYCVATEMLTPECSLQGAERCRLDAQTEAVSVYGKCSDDDGDESTKESGAQHGWGSATVETATTG